MIVLRAGELEATFHPSASLVGASLRHRGEELLGQRDGLDAYVERGKTMGVPFLHPWANRLSRNVFTVAGVPVDLPSAGARLRRDEHGLPIHGLLGGAAVWRVEASDETSLRASLEPDLGAAFPFAHRVEQEVTLAADGLTIATTLVATGDVPVPIAFGFHPYLVLPGAERRDWVLSLPARAAVVVDERGLPTGERRGLAAEAAPLGDRELDDGFDGVAVGAELSVAGGGRRLTVELTEGYPAGQVFAPTGADLIALEPMTAPTDALVSGDGLRFARPGEPFRAAFRLRVSAD